MPNPLEKLHHRIFDTLNGHMLKERPSKKEVPWELTWLGKLHFMLLADMPFIGDPTAKEYYEKIVVQRQEEQATKILVEEKKAEAEKHLRNEAVKRKMGVLARGASNAWHEEDVRYARFEGLYEYPSIHFSLNELNPSRLLEKLIAEPESPNELKSFSAEKKAQANTLLTEGIQKWRKTHFYKDIQNDEDDLPRKLTMEERNALQSQLERSQNIDIILNEDVTLRICPSYKETPEQRVQNERRNAFVMSGFTVDYVMNDPDGKMAERVKWPKDVANFLSDPQSVLAELEKRILDKPNAKQDIVFSADENFSAQEIKTLLKSLSEVKNEAGEQAYFVHLFPVDYLKEEKLLEGATLSYGPPIGPIVGNIRYNIVVQKVERNKYPKMAQYIIIVSSTAILMREVEAKQQQTFHEMLG